MATLSSPTLAKLIMNVRDMLNQPDQQNSTWSNRELTDYINKAIRIYFSEVIMNLEGQFNGTPADLNIVSGTETIDLPADCFQVLKLYKKVDQDYIMCPYYNSLTDGYSTTGGSSANMYVPSYFFRNNQIVLRPVPNFSETAGLRLEYIAFPETMIDGGDTLTSQISPVFTELVEMYAVYKAKIKQSLVTGVDMTSLAKANLNDVYILFRDTVRNRSKNPQYIQPFNPEVF